MSTDGIWEARNPHGKMFGREAIYNIIRQSSHLTAAKIQDAILSALQRFQLGVAPADDITLIIIKINAEDE